MLKIRAGLAAGVTVFGLLAVPAAGAQTIDETAVTRQAKAFGPQEDPHGPTLAGIPVAEIRWLLDRQEIRDCLARYTRGLDRHDLILLASAFWPDAQISYGTYTGSRDEFARWSIADDGIRWAAHTHNITQQTVDIEGNTAHVESYVLAVEQHPDRTAQIAAGRYVDRLERRHGEWRILVREFVLDTKAKLDGSFFAPGQTCLPVCGTWDRSDLSYKRPLERRPASHPIPPGTPPPQAQPIAAPGSR